MRPKGLALAALALLMVAACTGSDDKSLPTAPRLPDAPSFGAGDPFNSTGSCFAADVYKAGFLQQIKDSLGNQSLASGGCTSNDVRIATADVIAYSINGGAEVPYVPGTQVSCNEGDALALRLAAHVEETATSERTDIGIWIADDGGNGRTGVCKHFNLTNDSTGVSDFDGDSCGDMDDGGQAIVGLGVINAICQGATAADTLVHIGSCLGWTQPGTGGDDRTCPTTSSRTPQIPNPLPGSPDAFRYGTTPGTTSKCNCQGFNVPIVVRKEATIEVRKVCEPTGDGGTFDLKIDGSTGTGTPFGEDKACGGTTGAITVGAGTNQNPGAAHTVAEDGFSIATSNYISTVSCTKNGGAYIAEQAYTSPNTVDVQTNPNDAVVCTFKNVRKGAITIVKNTVPDGAQDFAFTTTGTGLSSFSLDDDADPTLQNSQTFSGLTPGAYSVTETAQTGFDLTALTCSDANSTGNTGTRTATINVEAGETVTCTFTNTQRGAINIVKNTIPDGAQDFTFTSNITGNANFSLDDDGDPTLSNTKAIANVVPGQYTVTEGALSGYALTALTCDDGASTTASTGDVPTRTATVNVEPGETVTCTFENTQGGSITIIKDAVPNGATNFSFSCSPNLVPGTFALDDDSDPALSNTQTYGGIQPGTFTCTETVPTGWDLTGLVCDDANSTEDIPTATATINLEAGESVTCTFTNTGRGTINIVKNTVPDGEQDFAFTSNITGNTSFSLDDDSDPGLSNTKTITDVLAGQYTVTETAQAGFDLTALVCDDANSTEDVPSRTATINLEAGETVTCTYTNTQRGGIIIVKNTDPDLPQDFGFTSNITGNTSFTLDDDADPALSNTKSITNVVPGQYSVTENASTGYNLTTLSCNDGASATPSTGNTGTRTATINVEPGETVTCTFTNVPVPNLSIVKEPDQGDPGEPASVINPGDDAVFSITVSNAATAGPALGVALTDTLPEDLTWSVVSETPNLGVCTIGTYLGDTRLLTCPIGTLNGNSSFTVVVKATVPSNWLLLPPADAGDPIEMDGNLVDPTPAANPKDWESVGINCTSNPKVGCAIDLPTGSTDNSFGQGTKEDDPVPTVVTGSIPNNKSDLLRFYVATERFVTTNFLYLAWERVQEPNGTTNMDFELNQSSTPSGNGVTTQRSEGDILIKYDLAQGGVNAILGFHRWVTAGACEANGAKPPCWGPVIQLSAAQGVLGTINQVVVVDPIPPAAPRNLSVRTFGEASINLQLSGIFQEGECVSFTSAYLKSRSSDSFTSAIKDFIAPIPVNITNCAPRPLINTAWVEATNFQPPISNGGRIDVVEEGTASGILPASPTNARLARVQTDPTRVASGVVGKIMAAPRQDWIRRRT